MYIHLQPKKSEYIFKKKKHKVKKNLKILTKRNEQCTEMQGHKEYIENNQRNYHPTKQLIGDSAFFRIHSKLFIPNHTK